MTYPYIEIWLYARPDRSLTIEERHAQFVDRMLQIGPPLGLAGLEPPPTPDCGDALSAHFSIKYPIRGLKCLGHYVYRGERYIWNDHGSFDEILSIRFNIKNKEINYSSLILKHLPFISEAFRSYRSQVDYEYHSYNYIGTFERKNPTYNALLANPDVDINGRNNIYTLYPVQFWDGLLCRRALGFDRDEVIRRLQDVAVLARPLTDGVYLVLSDNKTQSYAEFVEMNETIKPLLGLNYTPYWDGT